ncbi:sigma-54-dependent transcriptional regulator [Desulfurispora thermophila]|uniref:sigma-54-dependent transcriptional regulator n=1 Tax=Desulfurispora thermophila TaxID=265470 RepID=UPI00037D2B3F|nr:sigma-54 dependent transcriptional regulator [Desulfurispora thermophila]
MTERARILVIDDELAVGVFFRRLLERKNLRAVLAENGEQARRAWEREDFAVALVDIRLPDVSGLDLLRELKSRQPGCEVIMMTGYSTTRTAVKAIQLGAFDYLEKPFEDIAELENIVERALQAGQCRQEEHGRRFGWEELAQKVGFVVGKTPGMRQLADVAYKIARKNINVLIHGETGTGKEVLARFVHAASPRAGNMFIPVNCGAFPESLLESELFGHEKGAFTGAAAQRKGIFELAHRGTLFLDEVGEASPAIQVKLLRVLETGEFLRVGGEKPIQTDVRIIAATNVDLERAVQEKNFREDLFYRLDVVRLILPPLRDRREDIPLLAGHLVQRCAARGGRPVPAISPEAMVLLQNYYWPGNIRELSNVLEKAVALCEGQVILPHHLGDKFFQPASQNDIMPRLAAQNVGDPVPLEPAQHLATYVGENFAWEQLPAEQILTSYRLTRALLRRLSRAMDNLGLPREQPASLQELEKQAIADALAYYKNNISSAARALGIGRNTMYRKMKEYGLS